MRSAKQAAMAQIDELSDVILSHSQRHNLETVLAAGVGEGIVKNAAERSGLRVKSLSDMYRTKSLGYFQLLQLQICYNEG